MQSTNMQRMRFTVLLITLAITLQPLLPVTLTAQGQTSPAVSSNQPQALIEPDTYQLSLWDHIANPLANFVQLVPTAPGSLVEIQRDPSWPGKRLSSNGPTETTDTSAVNSSSLKVQLWWGNANDLDLWLTTPDGETIYYGNRIGESGGELDYDWNSACDEKFQKALTTTRPPDNANALNSREVETIAWRDTETPPMGTYRVDVKFYNKCKNNVIETPFRVFVSEPTNSAVQFDGVIKTTNTVSFEFDYPNALSDVEVDAVAGDYVPDSGFDANPDKQAQALAAEAINVGNGDYSFTLPLSSVPIGPDSLDLRLFYSRRRVGFKDNLLSPGWSHNLNIRLIVPTTPANTASDPYGEAPASNSVIFQTSDGARVRFTASTSDPNLYLPVSKFQAVLRRTLNSTGRLQYWTMILSDHTMYRFDASSYLTHLYRPAKTGASVGNPSTDGQRLTFTYKNFTVAPRKIAKLLIQVKDTFGRFVQFRYAAGTNRLVEICDFRSANPTGTECAGNTEPKITFSYTANILSSVTDLNDKVWTFTHGDTISLPPPETPVSNPRFVAENGKPLLTIVEDPTGRQIEQVAYDDYGCASSLKNGASETIATLDYTMDGNAEGYCQFAALNSTRFTKLTDGRNFDFTYKFNGGRFAGLRFNFNGQQVETFLSYNSLGRVSNYQDTNGHVTVTQWTPDGRRIKSVTDPMGNVTNYEYGPAILPGSPWTAGNLLKIIGPETPTNNGSVRNVKTLSYTNARYLTLPTSIVEAQEIGQSPSVLTNTASSSSYVIDSYGRVSRSDAVIGGTRFIRTRYNYYPNAGLIAYRGQLRRELVACAVSCSTVASGGHVPTASAVNAMTDYTYDTAGRVETIVNPTGIMTRIEYDPVGRVKKAIYSASSTTGAVAFNPSIPDQDVITDTVYDAAGRTEQVTQSVDTSTLDTTYAYDLAGRPTQVKRAYAGGEQTVNYGYDASSNQIIAVDANGTAEVSCYDILGNRYKRIESVQSFTTTSSTSALCGLTASSSPEVNLVTSFVYDAAGNVLEATDSIGRRTVMGYDLSDRLIKQVQNVAAGVSRRTAIDPSFTVGTNDAPDQNIVTQLWYDANGNLILTAVNRPFAIEMRCYDGVNRPTTQIVNPTVFGSLSNVNPLGRQSDYAPVTGVLFDQCSNPTGGIRPDADKDLVTTTEYDWLGRTTRITRYGVDVNDRQNTVVDYDALNRVTRRLNNYFGTLPLPLSVPYGSADQNVQLTYSYELDAATKQTHVVMSERFNEVGGSTSTSLGTIKTRIVYDRLGRSSLQVNNDTGSGTTLAAMSVPSGTNFVTRSRYNALGQAVGQVDPYGRSTTARYNVFGNIVDSVVNDTGADCNVGNPTGTATIDSDICTEAKYTNIGLLKEVTPANGRNGTTAYFYDKAYRVNAIVQNAASVDAIGAFNPNEADRNVITRYTYDAADRRWMTENNRGRKDTTCYDLLDRPTLITVSDASPEVNCTPGISMAADADVSTSITYAYEINGPQGGLPSPLVETRTFNLDATDRLDAPTTETAVNAKIFYDSLGRVVAEVQNFQTGVGAFPTATDKNYTQLFTYDKFGNLIRTQLQTADARVTRLCYDRLNRQIWQIVNIFDERRTDVCTRAPFPTTNSLDRSHDTDLFTKFRYDGVGRLIEVTDPVNRLTVMRYDGAKRLVEQIVNYTGSGVFNPAVTDQNVSIRYSYDYSVRPDGSLYGDVVRKTTKIAGANGDDTRTDRITYDARGNQIQAVMNEGGTPTPNSVDVNLVTSAQFDASGNQIYTADPNGVEVRMAYDKLDRLATIRDYTTTGVERTSSLTYDSMGNVATSTDPLNQTTRFVYDRLDRQTEFHAPLDTFENPNATYTRYGKRGLALTKSDGAGVRTLYGYDALGRMTCSVENYRANPSNLNCSYNDAFTMKSEFNKVDNDNLTFDVNVRTDYAYNQFGNLTLTTPPPILVTSVIPNAVLRDPPTMQYRYDRLDRRIEFVDAANVTWTTNYDVVGNVLRRIVPANIGTADVFIDTTYDGLSRATQTRYSDGTPQINYTYNGTTAQVSTMVTAGLNTSANPDTFAYDKQDRLIRATTGQGQITYGYDAGGRVTSTTYPAVGGSNQVTYQYFARSHQLERVTANTNGTSTVTSYVYDDADQLRTINQPNGVRLGMDYDANGRLVRQFYTTNAPQPDTLLMKIETLAFDARGNRKLVREVVQAPTVPPSGASAVGTSSSNSQPPQIAPTFSTGDESVVPPSVVVQPTLPPTGGSAIVERETPSIYLRSLAPSAIPVDSPYDESGTECRTQNPNVPTENTNPLYVERQIVYDYDCLYRLVKANYTDNPLDPNGQPLPTRTIRYDYTYQFSTSRKSEKITASFTRDGSPVSEVRDLRYFDYNGANQQIKVTSQPSAAQAEQTITTTAYTRAGNVSTIDVQSATVPVTRVLTNTFDAENRLLSTTQYDYGQDPGDLLQTEYTYNGLGEKVGATYRYDNGTTSSAGYLIDRARSLPEPIVTYENGEIATSQLFGMGKIGQYKADGWNYYGVDSLGSIRTISDSSGQVVQTLSYDPYGNDPIDTPQTSATPFAFAGEQTDGTGLTYLRARHYSSKYGVFLSRDPVLGVPGILSTFNGYSYAEGNPTNFTDPSGRIVPFILAAVIGSAIVAGVTAKTYDFMVTQGYGGANLGRTLREGTANVLNGISAAAMSFHRDPGAAVMGGINGVLEATVYPLLDIAWFAGEGLINVARTGQWQAEFGGVRRFLSDRVGGALVSLGLRDIRQTAAFQNGNSVGQAVGIIGDLVQLPAAIRGVGKLISSLPGAVRSGAQAVGNVARNAARTAQRVVARVGDNAAQAWNAFRQYFDDAGSLARDVDVTPPVFQDYAEKVKWQHAQQYPQEYIDNFVSVVDQSGKVVGGNFRNVRLTKQPQFRQLTFDKGQSGAAIVTKGKEASFIGTAIRRDSELFKTIAHEEMHLRLAERVRRLGGAGVDNTWSQIIRDIDLEEEYVEAVAVRYYRMFVAKNGPFPH